MESIVLLDLLKVYSYAFNYRLAIQSLKHGLKPARKAFHVFESCL